MIKRPKSKALAALHESMADLHQAGAIGDARMRTYDQLCLAGEATEAIYQVYKDTKGRWHWSLRASDGKILANSGENYRSRAACVAAIDLLRALAGAPVAA